MKFVAFIQSLFVPSHMDKRKGMNIFISIAILLVCTLLVALPSIYHFSNDRYNIMEGEYKSLNVFKYCVDEDDTLGAVTEEERNTYNMVYFKDIKALGIQASKDGLGYDMEKLVNGKEYVVKSYMPIKDEEGTITSYETWYIHIVVDDYDANNGGEPTYSVENTFCKNKREADETFHHVFVGFYNDGLIFLDSDDASSNVTFNYNRKTDINFNNAEDMTYCSHQIIDLYNKAYMYQATKMTFLMVFLFPLAIMIIFSLVFKGPMAPLKGAKEYIAVGTVASLTPTIACLIAGFINKQWSNYAMTFYIGVFVIYYLVIIAILLKRARFKREELKDFKNSFNEGR